MILVYVLAALVLIIAISPAVIQKGIQNIPSIHIQSALFAIGYLMLSLYPGKITVNLDVTENYVRYTGVPLPWKSTLIKVLYLTGQYEPSLTRFVKETVNTDDIVIDVGANEGYFSVLCGKITGDNGKVYAIEPIAENCKCITTNLQLNNLKNVDVIQCAAGDSNGELEIHDCVINRMWSSQTSSGRLWKPFSKITKVKKRRVDNAVPFSDRIRLIKIDVEGAESEVVRGMEDWIRRLKNCVWVIEMVPKEAGETIKLFKDAGYNCQMLPMESIHFPGHREVEKRELDENSEDMCDAIFTRT